MSESLFMRYVLLHGGAATLRIIILVCLLSLAGFTAAQEDNPPSGGLAAENVEVFTQTNAFGQPVQLAEGFLTNNGSMAYTGINLYADVLTAEDTVIGEGFGFLVNACGVALTDLTLQPGESQRFSLTLELFEEGEIGRVDIFPEGTAVDPAPADIPQTFTGIDRVTDREVVNLEWVDDTTLIYGVGCDADLFIDLQWFEFNRETGTQRSIAHPDAQRITPALLQQLGLTDPLLLSHSFLTFPPTGRRIVYQTDINVVLTAEPDGSFKRLIWDDLARRSLHGFIWLPEGRFLAYYYGAYGEEVAYFTASLEGQRISGSIYNVVPSLTIPGPTPDGARVVIAATLDGVTGYYLQQTAYPTRELLFEAAPETIPGNNFPPPIYTINAANEALIYLVRPIHDVPLLQCFDMQNRTLNDLTALPIDLTQNDRAWTWLSPDGNTLALAANGVSGGLWLVDLSAFGGCGVPLQG